MIREDVALVSLDYFSNIETLEDLPDALVSNIIDKTGDLISMNMSIKKALDSITHREKEVLFCRFFCDMTLKGTGEKIGITQERVRQIEAKALRKLRHPRRSVEMGLNEDYGVDDEWHAHRSHMSLHTYEHEDAVQMPESIFAKSVPVICVKFQIQVRECRNTYRKYTQYVLLGCGLDSRYYTIPDKISIRGSVFYELPGLKENAVTESGDEYVFVTYSRQKRKAKA